MDQYWNVTKVKAHDSAVKHGFWENKPSNEHFLCLIVSELMEAVEADRKSKRANRDVYEDRMRSLKSVDSVIESFVRLFEYHIKDTVEDELADTAIRLMDLAGAKNVNLMNGFCMQYIVSRGKSFTENIYAIVKDLVNYKYSLEEQLNYALHQIIKLSEFIRCDLKWHIEKKMEYNKTRSKKHNKKY